MNNAVAVNLEYSSRIRNSSDNWNTESGIQVPLTKNQKPSTWNPESTAWNPESNTVLDSPTWRDIYLAQICG